MKKLMIMMVLVASMAACTQETELSDLEVVENKLRTKIRSSSALMQDERFTVAYSKAVDRLKAERDRLTESTDLSSLNNKGGILVINSEKEFRPVYNRVVQVDTLWQNSYVNEIGALISLAKENNENLELYEDDDEISWEIEDLLEADKIGFYDLQKNISDKMPIETLWEKARNESSEWLSSQGENPEWEEDPDNSYAAETYARLFINAENSMIILDTVRYFDGETSFGRNDKGQSEARVQGAGGCRTFRMCTSFTDNTGEPTCLRARAYVNNFWIWRTYGVNGKGWIWRNGRWRERLFNKTLFQGGNIVIHNLQLTDPCDPAFARATTWNLTRRAVEFAISRTETNTYLGACSGSFQCSVVGRGRGEGVVMD